MPLLVDARVADNAALAGAWQWGGHASGDGRVRRGHPLQLAGGRLLGTRTADIPGQPPGRS
eukprot:6225208-Lingulodinium_polyedra.AAC.1